MLQIISKIFIIICTILIWLIIFSPSKNNITNSCHKYNNNTVITSNYIKNTFNYIIIIISCFFFITSITLNLINNSKIYKFKNNNNNVKILK